MISVSNLAEPMRVSVKIRHRHEPAPAILEKTGDCAVLVTFDEPQRAISPGQAAVFYDDDIVVGGGWISSSRSIIEPLHHQLTSFEEPLPYAERGPLRHSEIVFVHATMVCSLLNSAKPLPSSARRFSNGAGSQSSPC